MPAEVWLVVDIGGLDRWLSGRIIRRAARGCVCRTAEAEPDVIALILVLRLLHIISGAFWVGSVIMAVFFIEPTAKALGAEGDRFFAYLAIRRRAVRVMAIAATTAIGAGACLYWIDSDGLQVSWITSHTGLAFTAGAVAAVTAFAIAGLFLKPELDRLAALGSGPVASSDADIVPHGEDAQRFERRVRRWSLIQVALLVFAIGAMASARYLV
jgi:uncharacterized membrane protein